VEAVLYHLLLVRLTDKRPANRRNSRGPYGPPGWHPPTSRQGDASRFLLTTGGSGIDVTCTPYLVQE
jgi:hypothetical protein